MSIKPFFKDIAKFSIPTVVSAFIGILVLPLISRVYPEEEYGYISNFYSIGNMMMGIVTLGIDQAYIRYFNELPNKLKRNGFFFYGLRMSIFISLILLIIAFLGGDKVSEYLFNDNHFFIMILLAIYIVSLAIYRFLSIDYRFGGDALRYNFVQIAFILSNRLFFVIIAFYSTRYIYAAMIMTVSVLALDIYGLQRKKNEKKIDISIREKFEAIKYGMPLIPAAILVPLNNSIAKLVLGGYGFRSDVGVFAIATSAANVFSIIPSAFSVYWGSFMYKHYREQEKSIRKVQDAIFLLSIMLIVIIILFQDAIYTILGEKYRSSQEYFMIIMLMPISNLLLETTSYGINLGKKTIFSLGISVIGCLVNFILCKIFIPSMSAIGASIGIGVSTFIVYSFKTVVSQIYYRSIANYFRTFLSSLIIWGLCVGNIVFYNNINLRIVCIMVAVVFVFFLYRNFLINFFKELKGE